LKLRREHDEDQPWHIRALKELRCYIREVHKDNAQQPVSTTAFVDWLLEDRVSELPPTKSFSSWTRAAPRLPSPPGARCKPP
jgi:hypothetical protein